jgi:hypothetical protein
MRILLFENAFENVCKNLFKLINLSILTDNIFNLCSNTTFDDSFIVGLLF